jgi:response regulator RpfG family c-di-GMP phosphodiesterase
MDLARPPADANHRPRVICVDDEPHVVSGLSLHLRRRYNVEVATSGEAALELLDRTPEAAVIISDMRMPSMSGAELLAKARERYPNTTRILLTGYAEVDSAIRAINEGHVFRFLVKPCPPPELLKTVDAAAEQHRLVSAEQVLLERTLHGSVKMLSDILAITSPVAFGRASRIKHHVSQLLEKLNEKERWQTEVAAMLSQLGSITLPSETVEKLYYGSELSQAEQQMVDRSPNVAQQLLGHIPRLEPVRDILASAALPYKKPEDGELTPAQHVVRRGGQVLRLAMDFDALEAEGLNSAGALEALKQRDGQYDPDVLAALIELGGSRPPGDTVRDISVSALKAGMVFAADVTLTNGNLFVARGYEVTESFLERVRNFRNGSLKVPLKVVVRGS